MENGFRSMVTGWHPAESRPLGCDVLRAQLLHCRRRRLTAGDQQECGGRHQVLDGCGLEQGRCVAEPQSPGAVVVDDGNGEIELRNRL